MKEVVYDFEEFKEKVNVERGIHHSAAVEPILPPTVQKVVFRMYGISKDGQILMFEHVKVVDSMQHPELKPEECIKEALKELEAKFARPLGSTPGRWEE